jgi:hypothetical protein
LQSLHNVEDIVVVFKAQLQWLVLWAIGLNTCYMLQPEMVFISTFTHEFSVNSYLRVDVLRPQLFQQLIYPRYALAAAHAGGYDAVFLATIA